MNLFLRPLFIISLVVAADISAQLTEQNPLKFNEPIRIVSRNSRALYSDVGAMKTARQCGGPGRLLQWRRETCELTLSGPCVHPANVYTRGDVAFIPKDNAEALGLKVMIFDQHNGVKLSEFEVPRLEDSAVEGGKEYSLLSGLALGEEMRGKLINVKASIYRASDKKEEICLETDMLIV